MCRYLLVGGIRSVQGLTAPKEACMARLLSLLSRSVQRLSAHFARCGDTNTRMQWTDTLLLLLIHATCLTKCSLLFSLTCFLIATQLMSTPQTI